MTIKINSRVRCELLSVLLLSLPMASIGSSKPGTDLEAQRLSFKAAQHAIRANKLDVYESLKAELVDYPLYPYLRYEELIQGFDETPDQDLEAFLTDYRDTPLPYRLRDTWLKSLAKTERWSKFLAVYDDRKDTSLRCHHYYALIKEEQPVNTDDIVLRVWQVGHSQPKACDPLFDWLEQQGHLNSKRIWNRIYLAIRKGEVSLARHLAKKLSNSDQTKVEFWIRVHNAPDQE